jgi:hypothetical protein
MEAKALIVAPTGNGLYIVKYTGGGGTPAPLSGKYTSYKAANDAIALFQKTVQSSPDIKHPKPRVKNEAENQS